MKARALVEALGSKNSGFKTAVKDIEFFGQEGFSVKEGAAEVQWDLVYDSRTWGVKGLNAELRAVSVSCLIEQGEENNEQSFQLQWSEAQPGGWKVRVHSSELAFPASVYPNSVSIYLPEKEILVSF